jgi:hypothetical protein
VTWRSHSRRWGGNNYRGRPAATSHRASSGRSTSTSPCDSPSARAARVNRDVVTNTPTSRRAPPGTYPRTAAHPPTRPGCSTHTACTASRTARRQPLGLLTALQLHGRAATQRSRRPVQNPGRPLRARRSGALRPRLGRSPGPADRRAAGRRANCRAVTDRIDVQVQRHRVILDVARRQCRLLVAAARSALSAAPPNLRATDHSSEDILSCRVPRGRATLPCAGLSRTAA